MELIAEKLPDNVKTTKIKKHPIRDSKYYKEMTSYTATGMAEGFEEAESEEQVIAAWQYLHDTKLAYKLQGWFGRTAQHLIEQGIISQ